MFRLLFWFKKFCNIYFGLHLPQDGHKSAETCSRRTVYLGIGRAYLYTTVKLLLLLLRID